MDVFVVHHAWCQLIISRRRSLPDRAFSRLDFSAFMGVAVLLCLHAWWHPDWLLGVPPPGLSMIACKSTLLYRRPENRFLLQEIYRRFNIDAQVNQRVRRVLMRLKTHPEEIAVPIGRLYGLASIKSASLRQVRIHLVVQERTLWELTRTSCTHAWDA